MKTIHVSKFAKLDDSIYSDIYSLLKRHPFNSCEDCDGEWVLTYDNEDTLPRYDTDIIEAAKQTCIIPNNLFMEKIGILKHIRMIEFSLENYYRELEVVYDNFPYIKNFVETENITSVGISAVTTIDNQNYRRLNVQVDRSNEIYNFLEFYRNDEAMSLLVIVELFRRYYMGELDEFNSFAINGSTFRSFELLIDRRIKFMEVFNKIKENHSLIDTKDYFNGSQTKKNFNVFENKFLSVTNTQPYKDRIDLKFLGALEVYANSLRAMSFGENNN